MTGAELARAIAGFAEEKKAADIVELDLRGVLGYTDYFVVCSGNTERQAKAIHDGIHLGMKQEHGLLPRRVEGVGESRWILMDYLDVVVHVFTPETRDFYRLEQLQALPGAAARVRFFSMPRIDSSSSMIRARVAEGRPLRWLVPDAVAGYIAEHGLYGAAAR